LTETVIYLLFFEPAFGFITPKTRYFFGLFLPLCGWAFCGEPSQAFFGLSLFLFALLCSAIFGLFFCGLSAIILTNICLILDV